MHSHSSQARCWCDQWQSGSAAGGIPVCCPTRSSQVKYLVAQLVVFTISSFNWSSQRDGLQQCTNGILSNEDQIDWNQTSAIKWYFKSPKIHDLISSVVWCTLDLRATNCFMFSFFLAPLLCYLTYCFLTLCHLYSKPWKQGRIKIYFPAVIPWAAFQILDVAKRF